MRETGRPGNELGIGKLCSEGGGECGGSAPLCIADYAGSGGTAVCLPTACLEAL